VRVQDTEFSGADDPTLLECAAREGRVFLTRDDATFTAHAYDRVRNRLPIPGAIQIKSGSLPGQAIEDLLPLGECCLEDDLEGKVLNLPLRWRDSVKTRQSRAEAPPGAKAITTVKKSDG